MGSDEYLEKLFADSFKREVEQDEAIWRSLPFFATALGLAGALLGNVASRLPTLSATPSSLALHLCLMVSLMSLLISAGWLVEAIRPRRYKYLPMESSVLKFAGEMRSYYEQTGQEADAADVLLVREVRSFMIDELASATSENRTHNARKQHARTQALVYLIGSAGLAAIAALSIFVGDRIASAGKGTAANVQQDAIPAGKGIGGAQAPRTPAVAVRH